MNHHPDTSGLKPPWKPGESGNAKGRPSAGLAIREWVNQMSDWTAEEVDAALFDPKASMAKVAAARIWHHARSAATTDQGMPIAGGDIDRIFDRTEGKPHQSMDMTTDGQRISVVYTPQRRNLESNADRGGTEGAASEPVEGDGAGEAV